MVLLASILDGGLVAAARLSATRCDIDLLSARRGRSAQADAAVVAFGAEAGRQFALANGTELAVRAWLNRSRASARNLHDLVDSRLAIADGSQTVLGIGVSGRPEI